MVVATVVILRESALAVDGPPEFSAPDDERIVEHPALLEVFDEGVAGLVDVLALAWHASGDVGVVVPVIVVNLDEAYAALNEATGHEHAVRKATAFAGFFAVELKDMLGLLAEVSQFRYARLHAEGHLILLDARMRFGVADGFVVEAVQLVDAVNGLLTKVVRHAGRIIDEEDRITLAAEGDPGVFAR